MISWAGPGPPDLSWTPGPLLAAKSDGLRNLVKTAVVLLFLLVFWAPGSGPRDPKAPRRAQKGPKVTAWPRFSSEKCSQTEVFEGSTRPNHVIHEGFLPRNCRNICQKVFQEQCGPDVQRTWSTYCSWRSTTVERSIISRSTTKSCRDDSFLG